MQVIFLKFYSSKTLSNRVDFNPTFPIEFGNIFSLLLDIFEALQSSEKEKDADVGDTIFKKINCRKEIIFYL